VASTSRIPLGVVLDRSSPSYPDPILVESCFDDEALVSGPNGSHDFKHCSAPDQHPLVPRPSVVPTSSGAALSCVEIPQACNEGTTRGNAPPRGPSRVLHLDPVTSFLGTYQPFVDSVNCHTHPTLVHYPDFNNTTSCPMLADDLGHTRDIWKLCIIGYIAGKFSGYTTLNNLIGKWKCSPKLTIHDSGWLIHNFTSEANKIVVLSRGPYSIFGRPLVLKSMLEYFDFVATDMSMVPVWVRFLNLPLQCWSPPCLSKIASVLGKLL